MTLLKTPQIDHYVTIKHEQCRDERGGNRYYFRSHSDWTDVVRHNIFDRDYNVMIWAYVIKYEPIITMHKTSDDAPPV